MDQQQIEVVLMALQERNSRVDADKAWETSVFRRTTIALTTYVIAAAVFFSIGSARPFLDALIPSVGYVLSTLSLPALRRQWSKRRQAAISDRI